MQIVMVKFVKLILILILTSAFYGSVSDAFTALAVEQTGIVSSEGLDNQANVTDNYLLAAEGDVQKSIDRQGSYISAPKLPYISDAEIANSGGTSQLLTISRAQRSYTTTEYILSLKDVVEQIAHREDALSLHRQKLFDTSAFYRCSPASEYYVFALRRIII